MLVPLGLSRQPPTTSQGLQPQGWQPAAGGPGRSYPGPPSRNRLRQGLGKAATYTACIRQDLAGRTTTTRQHRVAQSDGLCGSRSLNRVEGTPVAQARYRDGARQPDLPSPGTDLDTSHEALGARTERKGSTWTELFDSEDYPPAAHNRLGCDARMGLRPNSTGSGRSISAGWRCLMEGAVGDVHLLTHSAVRIGNSRQTGTSAD